MIYCLIILTIFFIFDITVYTYWYKKTQTYDSIINCIIRTTKEYFNDWKYILLFINPFNSFYKIKFSASPSRIEYTHYILYKFINKNKIIYLRTSYNKFNSISLFIDKDDWKLVSSGRDISPYKSLLPLTIQYNILQLIKKIYIYTTPENKFQHQNFYFADFPDYLSHELYKKLRKRKFKKIKNL